MQATLHPKLSYWHLGWTALAFFTAMQLAAILVGFTIPADRRWLWWLIMPTFWTGFQALAVWILASCCRERIEIQDNVIRRQGMLKLQRISLGDVQEFRWRLWPRGGSAVLKNSGTRLVINWAEYEWAIVEPVLRWLRQSIPLNKQHGWELFAYQHLIPIELKFPAAASRQVTLTRRTWAKWFLPGAVLCFFAGIAVEVTRGTHQYWVGPMPILLLWLSLHFMTPREGIKTVRLSDSPVPDVAMVKPLALITVLSLSALTAIGVGVKLYPEYETEGLIAMYVVAAIVLTAIFCWSFQIDRAQRRIWEARGKELVPQWEREWLAAGTCASAKRL